MTTTTKGLRAADRERLENLKHENWVAHCNAQQGADGESDCAFFLRLIAHERERSRRLYEAAYDMWTSVRAIGQDKALHSEYVYLEKALEAYQGDGK